MADEKIKDENENETIIPEKKPVHQDQDSIYCALVNGI